MNGKWLFLANMFTEKSGFTTNMRQCPSICLQFSQLIKLHLCAGFFNALLDWNGNPFQKLLELQLLFLKKEVQNSIAQFVYDPT